MSPEHVKYLALLLETILVELRLSRGLVERDAQFLSNADACLYLEEIQAMRRGLFP
jgi:hypothetical protein